VTEGAGEQPIETSSFPDHNPHPVMRIDRHARLVYANAASTPMRLALGVDFGGHFPPELVERLVAGSGMAEAQPVEVVAGVRTFSLIAVPVGDEDAYNLYGTDVTAAKVIAKFPDLNPHPVLRVADDDTLLYANGASQPVVRALGIRTGEPLPSELCERIHRWVAGEVDEPIEVRAEEGLIVRLLPVPIPELGFTNLYGTDVTAFHAMNKFPDENPNPVLRVSRQGTLVYGNPASAPLCRALGTEVGGQLPEATFERMVAICDGAAPNPMELVADDRIFEVRVVALFEFDSINLYGTDVTAARQIAAERQKSESLLLNILPPSIAARMKAGEVLIADDFEDLAVLFADVVGFTPFASRNSAADTVRVLTEIFSRCDELVDEFGLEKIKTIGDAYMVVGGLQPDATQLERVADMALKLLDEMADYRMPTGERLQVRLGMHVGPAVGGVIGLKKFFYDMWGDTVNTASRMESHGMPGRLQVTTETYLRLKDRYEFEPRGNIIVKGKGSMPVFLLIGRKSAGRRPAATQAS
jgi:class 3 adenylate cyclase